MGSEGDSTSSAGGLVGLATGSLLLLPCLTGKRVPARLDLIDFFWPMKAYTAQRWRAGDLPLWNPLSGLGEPWLAQLQTGALYPLDAVFLLPFPAALIAGILLHLAVAAAGMAAYTRDLGLSRPGSAAAAAVYAGAGAFVSLVPVYNNFCTAAFLPWMLLGARRAVRGHPPLLLAVSVALSFLAGEPLLALGGTLLSLALALATAAEGDLPPRRGIRGTARVVLGAVLGVGLASAALLPFAELLAGTERLSTTRPAEALARSVTARDLADLVLPPSPAATSAPVASGRGGYLLSLVAGPLVLLLAAAGLAGLPGRPRLVILLGVAAVAGLLMSLGSRGLLGPLLLQVGLLPGIRFTARLFLFAHLFLAVAAGAGLDGWLFGRWSSGGSPRSDDSTHDESREVRLSRLLAALVSTAAIVLLLLGLLDAEHRDPLRSAALLGAAAVGAALVALGRTGFVRPERAGWGVVALLVASLGYGSRDPLGPAPAGPLEEPPPIAEGLRAGGRTLLTSMAPEVLLAATHGPDGSVDEDSPRRGRAVLSGYTALSLGIPTVDSACPLGSPRRSYFRSALRSSGPLLSLADVRHVVSPFPIDGIPGAVLGRRLPGVLRYDRPSGFGRAFFPSRGRIVADEAAARAALVSPSFDPETEVLLDRPLPIPSAGRSGVKSFRVARVLEDEPEKLVIETASSVPSALVVTRSWDPGWRATLDGVPTPLARADTVMLAVSVPAGEHRLVLTYLPRTFVVGTVLSGVSTLVLLWLWLSSPPPPPSSWPAGRKDAWW